MYYIMLDAHDFNRRSFLVTGIAFSASGLNGCAPLILRIVAGRVAARILARAIVSGGSRLGGTFGRGIAIGNSVSARQATLQGLRGTSLRTQKSNILRSDGSKIASTEFGSHGSYTKVNDSYILYSRRRGSILDHEGYGGHTGRSIDHGDYIEHQNKRSVKIAYDRIRLAQRVVEHFDRSQNPIGKTDLLVSNDQVDFEVGSAIENDIETIYDNLGLNCPDTKAAYDEWLSYQHNCLKSTGSCGANNLKREKWLRLLKECKA